MAIKIKRLD